jgi:hypothetical protein
MAVWRKLGCKSEQRLERGAADKRGKKEGLQTKCWKSEKGRDKGGYRQNAASKVVWGCFGRV